MIGNVILFLIMIFLVSMMFTLGYAYLKVVFELIEELFRE